MTWQVTDIGQILSPNGQRMRWSYTIVLKETGGTAVSFERVERGSYAPGMEMVGGTPSSRPYTRTLAANGELRFTTSESWGYTPESAPGRAFGGAATIRPLVVEYRFVGKSGSGQSVSVLVRIRLDRSVGKAVTPLSTAGPLPPAKTLDPADVASLAGEWRGSYRPDQGEFDIPVEVRIGPSGSFDAGENDPVTVRSRGTFSIRDGKLACSWGRDNGEFTLHEVAGKRILAGSLSGPRDGQAGTPSSTFRYMVRLERLTP